MKAQAAKKDAHLWARDPHDWYVEPTRCNDGLFAVERFDGMILDPCCGMGRVLDAAGRYGYATLGMDLINRGSSKRHHFIRKDFRRLNTSVDNIVSNFPYKHADEFTQLALQRARHKVALLFNIQWANAGERSLRLQDMPLRRVLAITPRPSMPPGAVIMAGETPGGGQADFAWFVFEHGFTGAPEFGWCREPSPPPAILTASRSSKAA